MNPLEISTLRLINQRIAGTKLQTAKEVISWMGAMQAQDYPMAKLGIGIRLSGATNDIIETSISQGDILRTHVMRPTWHFVPAEDIYWMLELTAPNIKSSLKSRHKALELTEPVLKKGCAMLEKVLSNGESLTREELSIAFEKENIPTDNHRLSHFMLSAELDGIVCSGEIKNNKQTHALLATRVPVKKTLTKDEALAELAKRYFSSHCPATIQDFAWWSGLSLTEARHGLEMIKSNFISEKIGTEVYWLSNSFSDSQANETSVYLLPAFDEFLISYRDRTASLSLVDNRKAISDNGLFRPVIVENGQVIGLWSRSTKKENVVIETKFFQTPNKATQDKIEIAAQTFEPIFEKKIIIK